MSRKATFFSRHQAGGLTALQSDLEWKNVAGTQHDPESPLDDWIRLQRSRLLPGPPPNG